MLFLAKSKKSKSEKVFRKSGNRAHGWVIVRKAKIVRNKIKKINISWKIFHEMLIRK